MPYVFVAVVVPIALMSATLIMERLERRVVGPPDHIGEERSGVAPPTASPRAVPPPSTMEQETAAEPPRAA